MKGINFSILEPEDFASAADAAIAEMQYRLGISVPDPSKLFSSLDGGDAPGVPLSIGGPYAEEWERLPDPEEAFRIVEEIYWQELQELSRKRQGEIA